FDVLDIREADPMGPFRGQRLPTIQVHYAHELLAKRRLADCVIEANAPAQAGGSGNSMRVPPIALRTAFPDDPLGQAARAAVELAAADRALPVIHLALNGLDGDKHHSVDTHWKQVEHHGGALERLAKAMAALRAGLIEIGRW